MNQKHDFNSLKTKKRSSFLRLALFSMMICFGAQLALANPETNFTAVNLGETMQSSVTGTVTDADGTPLPGANVLVKGTTTGTQTDFDGNYTINVEGEATLVFSYIGFVAQEIAVNGNATINATMVEDAAALDEVIVVGYTTQTRGDITGSIASVDVNEAMKVPFVNAAEALQGRVTGVTVLTNSKPGDAPTINIRGLGTVNNTGPLFIIDGVQTTDGGIFSSINPTDIQQMNVLKDGAAAIYGARAANGVIIVTTKSGGYNMGKSQLSLDIYAGISIVANTPDLLNPQQLGEIRWEGYANDGVPNDHVQFGNGATPVVPDFLRGTGVPSVRVNPNGTNWFDEITRAAPTTNISLSLASGDENSRSYLSLGLLNRDAVLEFNGFQRANIQINNEFRAFNKKLKIGQHLNVSVSKYSGNQGAAGELAIRMNPLIPVYDEAGDFAGAYSNSNGLSVAQNPVATLNRDQNDFDKRLRIFGDVYLSYELMDGLTAKTTLAGSMMNQNTRNFIALSPEHSEPIAVNSLEATTRNNFSWTWTNTINYNKVFGEHSVNAIFGIEALRNNNREERFSQSDFFNESPDFYAVGNGFGEVGNDFTRENENTLFSVFGSVDYNFAQKYFVTATIRNDKSSRFAEGNKTGVFPSFSAGWVISNEDFYPQDALVNRLKLKGSWGQLGNQDLPVNNPTLSLFEFNLDYADYVFNPGSITSGAILGQIGNPDLKWEISETTNFGIEAGMFDNRLTTSLEVWNISTEGLIVRDNQLISTTAPDASAPFVNIGNVKNTGIDFELGFSSTTDGDFTYSINANISHYRNEVVSLINGTPRAGSDITSWAGSYTRTEEGEPMSYFFGRVIDGFDADGRWVYKDINGDGTVDDDDRTKIGSPHPDFTYGLNLNGAYKGFDVSMFFTGSQGNDIYNHNKIFTDFPLFVDNNRSTRVLDSWRPDNTDAILPALSGSLHGNEINSNSYFIEDGSYFRLKNLQIGYNFAENISGKLKMDSFRIYVQGTNLFTITGYEGLDPEILPFVPDQNSQSSPNLNMGIDRRTFPIAKIYTIGLSIKF